MEQKTRPPKATQPQNWLMEAAAIDPVLVHLTTGNHTMLVGRKSQGRERTYGTQRHGRAQ